MLIQFDEIQTLSSKVIHLKNALIVTDKTCWKLDLKVVPGRSNRPRNVPLGVREARPDGQKISNEN